MNIQSPSFARHSSVLRWPLRRAGAFVLLLMFAACVPPVAAQSDAMALPRIESLKARIQSGDLDDEQRDEALADLDAAARAFEEAEAAGRQLNQLMAEAEELPARREELEERLASSPDDALQAWRARLPLDFEMQTLEDLLAKERSALADVEEEIDRVSQELVDILSGPASAATEIATLRKRIARLESDEATVSGVPGLPAEALALRREGELLSAQASLQLRQFLREWAASRQDLYELALRDLHLQRDLHVERVEILQTRVAAQGRTELRALIEVLSRRADALADSPAVVVAAARANQQLAEQLADHSEKLARDRVSLATSEQTRDGVSKTLRDARIRLEVGGTSKLVGRWLWSERRRLEAPSSIERRLAALRDELGGLRLDEVVLGEQRTDLEDIRSAAQELSARAAEESEEGRSAAKTTAALAPLLRQQYELLTLKEPLLRERVEVLESREQALVQQLEESQELQRLFDRYLLSAPSHATVDLDWLRRVPDGIRATINLSELRAGIRRLQAVPVSSAVTLLLATVVLVFLVRLRRRAPERIVTLGGSIRQIDQQGFRATAAAMGWTLLAALPASAALLLLGIWLQDVSRQHATGYAIGVASAMLVVPLYFVQLLYWTGLENGLGHRHFRWSVARRKTLLRVLPLAFGIILPMYFLSSLAIARNDEASSDVVARLAIVVACLTLAVAIWYSLAAGRLWDRRGAEVEPSAVRKLVRMTTILLVLAVAWFALQGFVYSASLLLGDILSTFVVLVAISLAVNLVGRWLLLGERRLAASRMEGTVPADPGEVDPQGDQAAEPDLSLSDVNAQTGRLLAAFRIALVIGGVLWVWSDALPAIARLEDISLWRVAVVGADGQPESQAITLLAVLAGIATILLTVAGARNLPGLIEIVLASYTRVDAASRYAVTSVLRYAIVIVGTLLALSILGMQWSRLQWLAAGLTVGLGFGLQEIFANFISGLILLFERPFRVGDIVTVGDLSGRVTRIRTRATTILDFDNREIVLPNKNFITGQLVNWTLSDSTTRLVIRVGVAYGSDPKQVHELLRRAAREHPDVLPEPESVSWFKGFGASSLDFDLLVWVASPRDRLPVQDALNTRIAELFAEHGIEIAFPQLDLHLRTLPEGQGGVVSGGGPAREKPQQEP